MRRFILLAAAVLSSGCTDALLGPAPQTHRGAIFDQLWHQFDLHYSFFALKNVNWDTLGARYRPLALAAPTDDAFAAQMGSMLQQLKDVHVSLTLNAAAGSTFGYLSPFDTITTYFNPSLIFQRYVTGAQSTSGGHMRYGMVAPTVGYVRLASFAGTDWADEMDEVTSALSGAASLIVDIRNNPGGDNGLAILLAGRFAAQEKTYGYVRLRNGPSHDDFTDYIAETVVPSGTSFGGKVFVLTDRRDFSSAEDFMLAMRVLPHVTIVGDTTAGASGGPITQELANGWSYELSEWIEYTPAKKMFEGVGLAPDVVVKGAASDAAAARDAIIERALKLAAP